MHYIFYIENGISLAISLKYIEEKKLKKEEVILFSGRNIQIKSDFKSIDLTDLEFRTSWFFFKGWIKMYKVKKQVNNILKENNIRNYIFHTSSVGKLSCYFLIKNKRCQSIFNIEDGRGAFYDEIEMINYVKSFHYSDNSYRFYQLKCWLNYFFLHYPDPNKTVPFLKSNNNALVSSKNAFSFVDNKYIVGDLFKNSNKNYLDVKCLMSLSYPVEDGLISLNEYLEVLRETFRRLIDRDIKEIHYKYHPQQFKYPEHIKAYNNILKEYSSEIKFVLLDSSEILESIMANSNAILLSDYSSIMIYTEGFGNEMISNYNLIKKHRKTDKSLPSFPLFLEQIIERSNL